MKDISGWERLTWSKVAKGQEGMSKGAVVNGCQWGRFFLTHLF